jgi:hypothetical protein
VSRPIWTLLCASAFGLLREKPFHWISICCRLPLRSSIPLLCSIRNTGTTRPKLGRCPKRERAQLDSLAVGAKCLLAGPKQSQDICTFLSLLSCEKGGESHLSHSNPTSSCRSASPWQLTTFWTPSTAPGPPTGPPSIRCSGRRCC